MKSPEKTRETTHKQANRWNDDQVALLMEAVARAPTAKDAFAEIAAKIGKSEGTVSQKFYALKRKESGGGRTKKRNARAKEPKKTVVNLPKAVVGTRLDRLSADELVQLAGAVRNEVARRQGELAKAAQLFR